MATLARSVNQVQTGFQVHWETLGQRESPDLTECLVHPVNRGRWDFLVHSASPETKANPDRLVKWG
jgi:hypothetical protein